MADVRQIGDIAGNRRGIARYHAIMKRLNRQHRAAHHAARA